MASVIVKVVKVLRFRTLFLLQRPLYSTRDLQALVSASSRAQGAGVSMCVRGSGGCVWGLFGGGFFSWLSCFEGVRPGLGFEGSRAFLLSLLRLRLQAFMGAAIHRVSGCG